MARGRSSGSRQSKHRVASQQARDHHKVFESSLSRAVFQEQSFESSLLGAGKGPVQERFLHLPGRLGQSPISSPSAHLRPPAHLRRATSEVRPSAACSRLVTALSSHPALHRRHGLPTTWLINDMAYRRYGSPTTWMGATSMRIARSDCV